MSLTQYNVWNHISEKERSIKSQTELQQHGYEFAKLCFEVREYHQAIKYLLGFLAVNDHDFRAHKLMAALYVAVGENEKAILHYQRCLVGNKGCKDIIEELAKLYCKLKQPNVDSMEECMKHLSQAHPAYFQLLEKIREMKGSAGKKAILENEIYPDRFNVELNLNLIKMCCNSGKIKEAFSHCCSVKEAGALLHSIEWQKCSLDVAERYYQHLKSEGGRCDLCLTSLFSVMDYCRRLYSNFAYNKLSLQCGAALIMKFDKVLCACGHYLSSLQSPLNQSVLLQNCASLYVMAAQHLLHYQEFLLPSNEEDVIRLAILCLLSSIKVSSPDLKPPRAEISTINALQYQHFSRTSVVGWMLRLLSSVKGEQYFKDVFQWLSATMRERKFCLIRILFSSLSEVKFGSESVKFCLQESFLAADESLLNMVDCVPDTELLKQCTHMCMRQEKNLHVVLWHILVYQALNVEMSVLSWVMSIFPNLERYTHQLNSTDPNTLCAYDVEAFLVILADFYCQELLSKVYSDPSIASKLSSQLCFKFPSALPIMKPHLQHWDYLINYCCAPHLSVQNTLSTKKKIQDFLGFIRTNLTIKEQVMIGRYFLDKAEKNVENNEESVAVGELLGQSSFYWSAVSKQLVQSEINGTITSHEATLLAEARMALAVEAVYQQDMTRALCLYSRVKTSHSAWNQSQIYLQLAGINDECKTNTDLAAKVDNLKQASSALDVAVSQLQPSSPRKIQEALSKQQNVIKKHLGEAQELAASSFELPSSPRGFSTPAQLRRPFTQDGVFDSDVSSFLKDPLEAKYKEQDQRILEITGQLSELQVEINHIKAKTGYSEDVNLASTSSFHKTSASCVNVTQPLSPPSGDSVAPTSSLNHSTEEILHSLPAVLTGEIDKSVGCQDTIVSSHLTIGSVNATIQKNNAPSYWFCDICLVRNNRSDSLCVACSSHSHATNLSVKSNSNIASVPVVSGSPTFETQTINPAVTASGSFSITSLNLPSISSRTSSQVIASTASLGALMYTPSTSLQTGGSTGQWICDACLVSNFHNDAQCIACTSKKPTKASNELGSKSTKLSASSNSTSASLLVSNDSSVEPRFSKPGFSLESFPVFSLSTGSISPSPAVTVSGFNLTSLGLPSILSMTTSPVAASTTSISFKSPVATLNCTPSTALQTDGSTGQWICDVCLVSNSHDYAQCIACTSKKPLGALSTETSSLCPVVTASSSHNLISVGMPSISPMTSLFSTKSSSENSFHGHVTSTESGMAMEKAFSSTVPPTFSLKLKEAPPLSTTSTTAFSMPYPFAETVLSPSMPVNSSGLQPQGTVITTCQSNFLSISQKPETTVQNSASQLPLFTASFFTQPVLPFSSSYSPASSELPSLALTKDLAQPSGVHPQTEAQHPPISSALKSLLTTASSLKTVVSSAATPNKQHNTGEFRTQSERLTVMPNSSPQGVFKFGSTGSTEKPNLFTPNIRCASGSLVAAPPGATPPSPGDHSNTEANCPEYEPDVFFKPLVTLPDTVELPTGEEQLNVLFENRAKLYRFHSASHEWKERGIGRIKVLVDAKSNKYRILMRRDQVKNVCCNHYVDTSMSLSPMAGSERAWLWFTPNDFSDGLSKPEKFAVKFKEVESAKAFKECFEDVVNSLSKDDCVDLPSSYEVKENGGFYCKKTNTKESVSDSNSGVEKYQCEKPIVCANPGVENNGSYQPVRQSASPSTEQKDIDSFLPSKSVFIGTASKVYDETVGYSKVAGNLQGNEDVLFITEILPCPEDIQLANKYHLPITFFNYKSKSDDCPGCRGCFNDNAFKSDPKGEAESADDILVSNTESSFSQLASSGDTWFFHNQKSTKEVFTGTGNELFQFSHSAVGDNPEAEVDLHFTPLVTLPSIDFKTGEEDEEVVFVHRAKLFRFHSQSNQWKERGVGELKILRNTKNLKSRVVMRRDQIKKLCCNHFINPDMSLTPNVASDTSWVWFTNADFTDGEVKADKFAVRFKHRETALSFKSEFEKSKKLLSTNIERIEAAQNEKYEAGLSEGAVESIISPVSQAAGVTICSKTEALEEKISPEAVTVCSPDSSTNRNPLLRFPLTMTPAVAIPYICPKPLPALSIGVSSAEFCKSSNLQSAREYCPITSKKDSDDIIFVGEHLPNKELVQKAQSLLLPSSFYLYMDRPPCGGCRGCNDELPLNMASTKSPEEDRKLLISSTQEPCSFNKSDQLTFSDLKHSSPLFCSRDSQFKFQNAGSQLFSTDDTLEADCDVHFKPLVSLPVVATSDSWDDNATALFVGRGKLFRFDDCQWKERGIGDIKIMQHNETRRSRVIMRRDQVLKLCCNHYITTDMHLLPGNSEKSWIWSTQSDYSEDMASAEKLAIRFKQAETSKQFGKVFESCVKHANL